MTTQSETLVNYGYFTPEQQLYPHYLHNTPSYLDSMNTRKRYQNKETNLYNNNRDIINDNYVDNNDIESQSFSKQQYSNNINHYHAENNKYHEYKRYVIIAIMIITAFIIYYKFGSYLTFSSLTKHHLSIVQYINEHPFMSPIYYILMVTIIVGLTIPGATILSIASGLFWNQPFASIYAWIGCNMGAILCFILIRNVCINNKPKMKKKKIDDYDGNGDDNDNFDDNWFLRLILRNKNKKTQSKFQEEGRVNGNTGNHNIMFSFKIENIESNLRSIMSNDEQLFLYLIYIRYVIIIPFWFVNVISAILQIQYKIFIISTILATIPGSLLYTIIGRTLNNILTVSHRNHHNDEIGKISFYFLFKKILWTSDIIYCILLLVICLIIPFAIKKYYKIKNHGNQNNTNDNNIHPMDYSSNANYVNNNNTFQMFQKKKQTKIT